jgi:aerobic carbon-monoxide dehydrogenase large subunit
MTSDARADTTGYGIGSSPPRVEDERLIRGRGRFTDDIRAANEMAVVLLRSPHSFARIVSVDLDAARAAPGVVHIATIDDLKRDGIQPVPVLVRHPGPDGKPMFVPDRHALADGFVRFVGDPVVALFAGTYAEARDAAELCTIDYETVDAVAEIGAAIVEGAPQIWPEAPANRAFFVERGNSAAVDAAFAKADRIVAAELRISRVAAIPLEPRAALAEWSPAEERFTLTAGTHTPHSARNALAAIFGLSPMQFRVAAPDLGGSFGMREGAFPEYILALWGARKFGRPVRWRSERSEAMSADYHGRDNVAFAELALDADGIFTGLRVRTLAGMGAYYSQAGSFVPVAHVGGLSGVYRTPAIHTAVTGVFTNTSPIAPYRGAGRPEAIYVLERMIDIAAAETGIDRIGLRRRNLIPALPWKTGFLYIYDSGDFAGNMAKALAAANWDGFPARRAQSQARGMLRGIGLANSIEPSGGGPPDKPFGEDADIRFGPDGHATLLVGTKSHGQGHETLYAQLMAEKFGLRPGALHIVTGDTDRLPNGMGSFASRSTAAGGTVVLKAADRIIDKGKRLAAHLLEASAEDIEFERGAFSVVGTDRSLGLIDICRLAHDPFRLPRGEDLGLSAHASVAPSAGTFPTGCHICEVEIDPETGQTTILRYLVVDDVGKAIHPGLVAAQLHGGAAQGIGQALMEEIRYDDIGQLISGSLQDYALPRASDLPWFEVESNPTPTAANPLGAKGVGEAGTVGALPAFANAVMDALSPYGIRHLDMPLTPLRIWSAIRQASI